MRTVRIFSGFLGAFMFAAASLISTTLAPGVIEEEDYVLSSFGETSETMLIFNGGLVLSGILFILFFEEVRKKLHYDDANSIFYIPGITFALVGIISLDVSELWHFVAFMSFLFSWLLVVMLISWKIQNVPTASLLRYSSIIGFAVGVALLFAGVEFWIWGEFWFGIIAFFHIFLLTDFIVFHQEKSSMMGRVMSMFIRK